MIALKTVIGNLSENQSAKRIAYVSFLVFTTILVLYSTMLLFYRATNIEVFGQSPTSSSSPSGRVGIKIDHPDYGQITSVKNKLEISGESKYDLSYSCHLSVIINKVKPYQKTTPTGDREDDDYSTWKYIINSDYTDIKEGDNRITARLICTNDMGGDLRKWYSVNVVGQTDTENNDQSRLKNKMISIPSADTGSVPAGLSPTIIKIDRNTFLELISDKIRNDSAAIKDSIEDSIMHVYSKHDGTEYNR
jgi:hypothetical protein